MDMFMDKLAQKLTAQEIIKANTAADIEELNRLKNQIAEYNECLAKLQKLIDDGAAKLADAQAYSDEMDNRILGSVERVQAHIEETNRLVRAKASEDQTRTEEIGNLIKEGMSGLREYIEEAENLTRGEVRAAQTRAQEADSLAREGIDTVRSRIEEMNNLVRAQADGSQARGEEVRSLIREGFDGIESQIAEMNTLVREASKADGEHREKDNQIQKEMNTLQSCMEETNNLMRAEADGSRARLQESLEELQALRHDVEMLRQIQGKMAEKFDSMDKSVAWQLELMTKSVGEKLEQLGVQDEVSGQLGERLDAMEESVHRECVKVYRNVQAVVTEESGRQEGGLTEMKSSMADVQGKLKTVLAFSALAMILSLAGVAFQVFGWLNTL